MSRILRYLACLFMLIFVGNALAAGYSCPSYKQYTSCNSGYYMTASSSSTTCNTTPGAGNACRPCSLMGSNYTCPGGTSCPELNEVTITYNLNGGSGTKPSAKTCTPGTSCSLASGATTSFYRAGYVFKGWSTSSTATSGSTSITFNANDTVYAVWSACAAGTYKAGSGTQASASCRACSGRTKYQNSTGQSSCKTVSSGYYTTGCNSSGNSCTGQSQCTGATYCSGGVQNSCPAQTSGWTRNTGTGWTSYTQCNQTRSASSASEYCRSGTLKQNATSATRWGTTTVSSTLYADAGSYVNGTTCTQCQKGYACPGGAAERKACDDSLQYQNLVGQRTCKLVEAGYYKSSNSAQAQCPANYRDGTAAANINNCKTSCAGGTYVATANAACTSVGTGYYKGAHTVNYGSTSTRSQCPANYRDGAAASAQNGCKTSCDGGTYVATANAACTSVGTGYYKGAHTVNYGSTSTRSQCPSGYRNGAAAANQNSCIGNFKKTGSQVNGSVPTNCSSVTSWNSCTPGTCTYQKNYAGTITSDCTPSNCTKTPASVTAKSNFYVDGTSCDACPSGYPNSDAGAGAITLCYSNSKSRAWTGSQTACAKPTGCYSVTCNACSEPACSYVAYANNAGTGDGTIKSGCSSNNKACQQTVNTVTANAGRYVSGKTCPACAVGTAQGTNGSTATSCSVCSGNTYAASAGMATCSACPSGYSISGTAASNHDAKSDCKISCAAGTRVTAADAACTTPTGSWYTAAHTVAAGSTTPTATIKSCLTNYATPNTSTRTDHDASSDCKISCAAGTRITTVNATSCTTPAGNWYIGAHSVAQGSTSSVNTCLTNYTISGTAASNHDAASDCKISCGGGSYIAAANNTSCSAVGAGYWAAASTVSQGSAGVRNQCDEGLTTIGSGAGADEVGDCGRVLNVNGEKIYLRSTKKTTPSLNVSISGTTFYGNMGASSIGSLKLKSDGTTYSVYDDSMQ